MIIEAIVTRDAAVQLARQALENASVRGFDEIRRAVREVRDGRIKWLVIFALKEEPGVVTTPGEVFVEIDEETQAAKFALNP